MSWDLPENPKCPGKILPECETEKDGASDKHVVRTTEGQ